MMKPFRSTLPLDDALAIVREAVVPIARTERVPIEAAHGRVLARTIVATHDVPSFDRAAMDGYALIAADTHGASRERPATLTLAGRVYAGDAADTTITPGTCLEIATGAPLPPGADAVIMVEETAIALDAVHAFAEVRPGQHIVRRAADMRSGDVILQPGALLEPSRVGALAAVGHAEAEVYAKPVVAILPTGNELVAPGQPLPAGHVYDVNRYTLGGVVDRHGGIPLQLPTVIDTPEAVRAALDDVVGAPHARAASVASEPHRAERPHASVPQARRAGPVDLLIICGGSSVGERDLVIDALRERGEVLFHGIAVKPGKPTAFARLTSTDGTSTLVLGMPGNPTSCLSNAYILLIPLLRALARLPAARPTTVRLPLGERVTSPRGRLQFLPVCVRDGRAIPTFKGSGEITSLSQADGYITIPDEQEWLDADTLVDVVFY
jgi:molybdopterin molybdotransferase